MERKKVQKQSKMHGARKGKENFGSGKQCSSSQLHGVPAGMETGEVRDQRERLQTREKKCAKSVSGGRERLGRRWEVVKMKLLMFSLYLSQLCHELECLSWLQVCVQVLLHAKAPQKKGRKNRQVFALAQPHGKAVQGQAPEVA